MKKNLLRIFCILLALTMLVGLTPVLAADDITVYVSVSDQGVPAQTKDGNVGKREIRRVSGAQPHLMV